MSEDQFQTLKQCKSRTKATQEKGERISRDTVQADLELLRDIRRVEQTKTKPERSRLKPLQPVSMSVKY